MNALEVIGAAGIWAFYIFGGVLLGLTAFALLTTLFDRLRIHRAFWHFKGWGWLSEDELNQYLEDRTMDWWRGVADERMWSRTDDFRAGARAAAYHLLRSHTHIVKGRRRKVRSTAPPQVLEPVLDEVHRAMAKYPTWPTDMLHALAVLGEEYGELNKAVLQQVYEPHKNQRDDVRKEAVQTAAMALRFIVSLDTYSTDRCAQHAQQLIPAVRR